MVRVASIMSTPSSCPLLDASRSCQIPPQKMLFFAPVMFSDTIQSNLPSPKNGDPEARPAKSRTV